MPYTRQSFGDQQQAGFSPARLCFTIIVSAAYIRHGFTGHGRVANYGTTTINIGRRDDDDTPSTTRAQDSTCVMHLRSNLSSCKLLTAYIRLRAALLEGRSNNPICQQTSKKVWCPPSTTRSLNSSTDVQRQQLHDPYVVDQFSSSSIKTSASEPGRGNNADS